MTWMKNLYKTYEENTDAIGRFEKDYMAREFALIPVSHTTQSSHIEVSINESGEFMTAQVVDKSDASTIIPCSEASASRTSKSVPHPLFDKLPYVAGDYIKYGGSSKKANLFQEYMSGLAAWCDSSNAHPKVKSVYSYLQKGTLIKDLIDQGIIMVDEENKFIEKWNRALEEKYGEKTKLFKVIAGEQSEAFVRFQVFEIGGDEPRLWRDRTVFDSFAKFYEESLQGKGLCYVTGEQLAITDKHASRIRNSADKAKLISANDTSGFTFRGRFRNSGDAVSVSYEVSQKAHNALKWLIARQGYSIDGKVFLVWGTQGLEVPDPFCDTEALTSGASTEYTTHKEVANQVRRAIDGYRNNLEYRSEVISLILDAATTGRMAIVYYHELDRDLFLERLKEWHTTCIWRHQYKEEKKRAVRFVGTPATRDIAFAAYGSRVNNKLVKELLERMLPCIVDGREVPKDIVRSAFNRALNPISMEEWEWEKTLGVTCALIKKTYKKEALTLDLNINCDKYDYLLGRMLAIIDKMEGEVLRIMKEERATNAARYMTAFAQHPARTWKVIYLKVQPYQVKYSKELQHLSDLLDEVTARLKTDIKDEPLDVLFLIGFSTQRHEFNKQEKEKYRK